MRCSHSTDVFGLAGRRVRMTFVIFVAALVSLLLQSGQGALINDAELGPAELEDGEDMGIILFVDGIAQVGAPVMQDLCDTATEVVESMDCVSIWSDGAFMKSKLGIPISEADQETIKNVLQQQLSSNNETRNGTINLEPNLEVVEGAVFTQSNAPRNLGRLDQGPNTMDNVYTYTTTGKGVNVYVLDKGINKNHVEFKYRDGRQGSRVKFGITSFSSDASCAGHGTHVAGIVGGLKYGVAKDVEIVMVQVQPCKEKGSVQYLLGGMDWVLNNVKRPAVVQMSLLALGKSYSLNKKVQQIIDANIPFVLSAGNYANDACFYSPAMVSDVIVVGNVESDDRINKYSNYGKCLDLFAPGASIRSASSTSNTLAAVMTGTSQAAPHVSGVVAQYLEREPLASLDNIMTHLLSTAARGYVKDAKGSPNYLLQVDTSPTLQTTIASLNVPGMFIEPRSIPPVNMFEGSVKTTEESSLTIFNDLGSVLNYQISMDSVDGSDVNRWVSFSKYNGSLAAGEGDEIKIIFTSANVGQGIYQADVFIESNDFDRPAHSMRLSMRLFCERVAHQKPDDAFITMHNAKVTSKRPADWGPEPPGGDPASLYLDAIIALGHPVLNNDPLSLFPQMSQAMSVTGGGYLDLIEDYTHGGRLCSTYHIRARGPRKEVWNGVNEVCIAIEDNILVDVNMNKLPGGKICEEFNDSPQAKLFGAYMMYSSDQGLFTTESNTTLLAAFSEEVKGVGSDLFYIETGDGREAYAHDTKLLDGSTTFYEVLVGIPKDFYGEVKVSIQPGIVDTSGKALKDAQPLTFTRVENSILHHTSFNIRDEL